MAAGLLCAGTRAVPRLRIRARTRPATAEWSAKRPPGAQADDPRRCRTGRRISSPRTLALAVFRTTRGTQASPSLRHRRSAGRHDRLRIAFGSASTLPSKHGQIYQIHFGVLLVDGCQHPIVLVQEDPGSEKLEHIEITRAHGRRIVRGANRELVLDLGPGIAIADRFRGERGH